MSYHRPKLKTDSLTPLLVDLDVFNPLFEIKLFLLNGINNSIHKQVISGRNSGSISALINGTMTITAA